MRREFRLPELDETYLSARGLPWETISAQWHGRVSREAIAEAIQLARKVFVEHATQYPLESQPA